MKLDDGRWTTIHKDEKAKFAKLGKTFGPEARGAATWHKEEALAIEKYGIDAYIFDKRYEGQIAMVNTEGRTHAAKQSDVARYLKAGHKLGNEKNLSL